MAAEGGEMNLSVAVWWKGSSWLLSAVLGYQAEV